MRERQNAALELLKAQLIAAERVRGPVHPGQPVDILGAQGAITGPHPDQVRAQQTVSASPAPGPAQSLKDRILEQLERPRTTVNLAPNSAPSRPPGSAAAKARAAQLADITARLERLEAQRASEDAFKSLRNKLADPTLPPRERQRVGMELLKARMMVAERLRDPARPGLGVPLLAN
jgi:hypothetical protein